MYSGSEQHASYNEPPVTYFSLELVSKGANQEQKADIALASKGKILGWASLVLRPIINPSRSSLIFHFLKIYFNMFD